MWHFRPLCYSKIRKGVCKCQGMKEWQKPNSSLQCSIETYQKEDREGSVHERQEPKMACCILQPLLEWFGQSPEGPAWSKVSTACSGQAHSGAHCVCQSAENLPVPTNKRRNVFESWTKTLWNCKCRSVLNLVIHHCAGEIWDWELAHKHFVTLFYMNIKQALPCTVCAKRKKSNPFQKMAFGWLHSSSRQRGGGQTADINDSLWYRHKLTGVRELQGINRIIYCACTGTASSIPSVGWATANTKAAAIMWS